jgi:hypothetical protein
MPTRSSKNSFLDTVLAGKVRWLRRKRPLEVPRTSKMQLFCLNLRSSGECRISPDGGRSGGV